MDIRYPRPLVAGDLIGVTAPSSGVPERLRARLDFAIQGLKDQGFQVDVGECLDGATHISAPVEQRAAEFMRMLLDPRVRAIVPPWGGETAIDLIAHLDFDAIAAADPTWIVGYSDISTLLTPITLLTGMATMHGSNLMDTPYATPASLVHWLEIARQPVGASFHQSSPNVHRLNDRDDWSADPDVTEQAWNGRGRWARLDAGTGPVDVTGRLIGGCIETMANLAGTRYADMSPLRGETDIATLVYIEAAGDEATAICRYLHGMRLAGFFDGAAAVLVGRTGAKDSPTLTQLEAVLDALGTLGLPIIGNVECGHVPPQLPIVNGALGRLVFTETEQFLQQSLR
ncbi:Muramoyltetrapeptide carboxypeptidase LdcA (peptidoglycan recycling) [Cryobacterium flavum]|uniref:LD-carboxypeptidase n=1 Tax=Cryobacterium flavum TaxID=1424659 RepID=A0A4R8UY45_9MICO|nr:S66 peptidase family protein [Cryobacterium flavum]TFB72949.1 LD-carboxypeptidase [Cryobacterium flavum]SDN06702.1 Muramoyltetrapeptide carboxypeptidase LdcA (peptidoglycan recycling) [Cryobacterium flavum]